MAALNQAAAKPGTSTNNQTSTQEYVVRAPNDASKKFSMIKFSTGTDIDFLKLTNTTVRMERENNLREFKSAHNMETMPKFGAGSEYGREQKEEARRKKYGINIKKYVADNQPWLMKIGKGKDGKRYKGVREGTITENTSYYIFTQCADGAFEAFPIEEWYNFQPVVQYKYLNSEEAEEEFGRRDKTMNMFSIMIRNRIKNKDDDGDKEEEKKETKKEKNKSLILTDMEDWAMSSDDEDDGEGDDTEKKPKKENKKGEKKRRKNAKINDNDEAVEESDEGDFDDRELDYISDSGSESELDEKDKNDKYDDQGVDQEHGLKKLIDSEEESSEDEKKEGDEDEEEEEGEGADNKEAPVKEKKKKKEKKESTGNKGDDDSDSSSSSSESDDSDIDKNEEKFASVLFMQKKKGASRSTTPTIEKVTEAKSESKSEVTGVKRKMESDDSVADPMKKIRTESPALSTSSSTASLTSSGEITEEAIRRYLTRKPMTARELVQKFHSKKPKMTKEQMTQRIGQLLKKINPDRKYVNNTLYLSLKKAD